MQDCIVDFENSYYWNLIYSFHMAAFMAISGYVSYKPQLDMSVIKKRSLELLLPFFVWSFICSLFMPSMVKSMCNSILHPDTSYWFLWVLFFVILLFQIASKIAVITKKKQEHIVSIFAGVLILLMTLFQFRLFGFQFIAYYFVFYSIGFFLKKYKDRIVTRNIWFMVIIGSLWLLGASFWKMHELPPFLENIPLLIPTSILQYAYRALVALLAIYFLISFCPRILDAPNIWNKSLAYLGRWSLGIYVVHLALPFNYFSFFKPYMSESGYILFLWLFRSILALGVVRLLSMWKVTACLLLGKINFKKSH